MGIRIKKGLSSKKIRAVAFQTAALFFGEKRGEKG